jgi:hypothetical protein
MSFLRKKEASWQSNSPVKNVTRRDFVRQTAMTLGSLSALPRFAYTPALFSNEFFPDETSVRVDNEKLLLQNSAISAEWQLHPGGLEWIEIRDKRSGTSLHAPGPVFKLSFTDGTTADSSTLSLAAGPRIEKLHAVPSASRFSERIPGHQIVANFRDSNAKFEVQWRAILREGSHYIREELTLKANNADLPLREITPIYMGAPSGRVLGSVDGSPVVVESWFRLRTPSQPKHCRKWPRTVQTSPAPSAESRPKHHLFFRGWCHWSGSASPRLSALCRTGARSSVPNFSALQLLV